MIVCLGLPLLHRNALFNCACLAVDGRIAGFVAKRFLAGDGLHYEPRWFKPWPQQVRDTIEIDGREYPIGDLVFDCGGVQDRLRDLRRRLGRRPARRQHVAARAST